MHTIIIGATLEIQPGHVGVNDCVCPGDNLIYKCTVQGATTGATVWNGTAFSGCPLNEIILFHRRFPSTGDFGECNNGNIVGRSLGVEGNNFASQLNVTVTPDIAGKTITCFYDTLTTNSTNDMIQLSTIVPGNTLL